MLEHGPRRTCIHLVLLSAVALAGCGGGSSKPTAPRQWKAPARMMGTVSGFVVDDESGTPIANAQVSVGGTAVRTRADGSFEADAPAGRARVEVKTDGFIQSVREVAVGDVVLSVPFKLARKEPARLVGAGGGSYTFREASLSVPPGAFGDGTMLSLTFLDKVRVAVTANAPQFIDSDKTPRRVMATVDLDASAPPAMPVRVRVPVPDDAAMDSVKAFASTATGDWGASIMPISVSGGIAEFELSGNGRLGVAIDTRKAGGRKPGYLVTEGGGAMNAGEVLPGGNEVMTASRAVAMVDPQGTRIEVAPGSRARAEVPASDSGTAGRVAPFAGSAVLSAGSVRVLVPKGDPSLVKLTILTPSAKLEARGTAFTVSSCESGEGFVDVLSVGEGVVDAEFGGKVSPVNAHESITLCTSCAEGQAPMCFMNQTDAGVMVQPDLGQPMPMADAMLPADAAVVPPDMAVMVMPDAAVVVPPPDAATPPLMPDAPVLMPDAAPPKPDAAVPPPDAPVLMPDTAVLMPDAAPLMPDAEELTPDAAPVMPDMAALMQDAAPLTPDASAAKMAVNPTAGDYGTVMINTYSGPIDFTVTNTGDTASGALSVSITGEYFIESNSCVSPLASQGSCVVRVKMYPLSVGNKPGALTVSAQPGGTANVPLTGYGADAAKLEVLPATAVFLDTAPGTVSQSLFLTVKNTGGLMSGFPTITLAGTDYTDFTIDHNGCTAQLASGETCQVDLLFTPSASTTPTGKQAQLIASASPGGNAASTLVGNATFVEVLPTSYNFGNSDVANGVVVSTNFTVKNIAPTGGTRYIGIAFAVSGANANDFTARSTDCANALPPGGICTVTVDFKAGAIGSRIGVLDVSAHEPGMANISLGLDKAGLSGNGI